MIDVTSAAIATLLSAATSATVSYLITKSSKKRSIDDQLDGILKIAVQYPYLESRSFTEQWSSKHNDDDERMLRYDMYCNMLFNYLSRLSDHFAYNEHKIENFLAMKSWVRLHRKNWLDPRDAYENVDSYGEEFVKLMNKYTQGA